MKRTDKIEATDIYVSEPPRITQEQFAAIMEAARVDIEWGDGKEAKISGFAEFIQARIGDDVV